MTRPFDLRLTDRARRALQGRDDPLVVEMELYFSCLIRKRVLFPEQPHDGARAQDVEQAGLALYFRPVMTRACSMDAVGDHPDLIALPMTREGAFQPRWLRLDYRHGQWEGEFGYV